MALNIKKIAPAPAEGAVPKIKKLGRPYGAGFNTPPLDARVTAMAARLGYTDPESLRVINEYQHQHRVLAARFDDPRAPNSPVDKDNLPDFTGKRFQLLDWMRQAFDNGDARYDQVMKEVDREFGLTLMKHKVKP